MAGQRFEIPAAIAVPGMTVRASFPLGSGEHHILQFERTLDADASQEEINFECDKMMQAGDRLRAKYELPGLRRQLANVNYKLALDRDLKRRAEAQLDAYKKARLDKARELRDRHQALFDEAYGRHVAEGRMAEFQPEGALKGNLERLKSEIEQLSAPVEDKENDVVRAVNDAAVEIEKGERAIRQLTELIQEGESLARGEDISGV
jgi:hypothetical protein